MQLLVVFLRNTGYAKAVQEKSEELGWNVFIPAFEYCTDNAAMIAIAGHYKFLNKEFVGQGIAPASRMEF